jgi:hypothetical protein
MLSPDAIRKMKREKEFKDMGMYIQKIDAEMRQDVELWHREGSRVEAIIEGEPSLELRNEIARCYIDEAGWGYVYHQTSSENGERPGLTHFIFTEEPMPEKIVKGWHKRERSAIITYVG